MIFERRITVPGHEADCTGHWRLASVFNEMQHAAEMHANKLGIGHRALEARGIFWVISRIHVTMETCPSWGDEVAMGTWPRNVGNRIFPREFRFAQPGGELLGEATSVYLLKHRETGQIVRVPEGIVIPDAYPEGAPPFLGLGKLVNGREMRLTGSRRPRYSDIDLNGHVNNQRYAQWICDLFDPGRFVENRIKTMQINYLDETRPEDTVEMYLCEEGRESFVCGRRVGANDNVFEARCEWIGYNDVSGG